MLDAKNSLKIALYLLLTIAASIFGYLAYSNYSDLLDETPAETAPAETEVLSLKDEHDLSQSSRYSNTLLYGAFFVMTMIFLGLLLAHDLSNFLSGKAFKMAFDEEAPPYTDPEYELAEQEWADGHFLEAIRMMREYLQNNPREQHVALRIAEIYEKDLNNPLAAALEYEEVLKKKLPPERWGWAAIHLCNLYFRLNKADQAIPLLRRIDTEYGQTAAAEKARKRLAQIDGNHPSPEPPLPEPEPEAMQKPGPELPPGFSPKKR